jgi:uncharacterized membrane protein
MPLDTFAVIAGRYDAEGDALADFEAVREVYLDLDLIDTYDAAVISKHQDGEVRIVKTVEEPTRQGAVAGLGIGLALGALTALFPAIGIGAGLLAGGAIGAGAGAIAGHVRGGMSREDLKEIGELLEAGTSGLLVIAATDVEAHVEEAITRAKETAKKDLQADTDDLKAAIDAIAVEAK